MAAAVAAVCRTFFVLSIIGVSVLAFLSVQKVNDFKVFLYEAYNTMHFSKKYIYDHACSLPPTLWLFFFVFFLCMMCCLRNNWACTWACVDITLVLSCRTLGACDEQCCIRQREEDGSNTLRVPVYTQTNALSQQSVCARSLAICNIFFICIFPIIHDR